MENTHEQLKNALDVRYYKLRILIFAIVYLGFTMFGIIEMFIVCLSEENDKFLSYAMMIVIPITCICVPIMIWYWMQIRILLRNSERYQFYEVILDKMVSSGKMAYFIFKVPHGDEMIEICTKSIFFLASWFVAPVEAYINKKAMIAFDERNDRVVVVKIIDEQDA